MIVALPGLVLLRPVMAVAFIVLFPSSPNAAAMIRTGTARAQKIAADLY